MEVHHHSHHPKKWKEYITEFLMLFLAVSLGFVAENLREDQVNHHKALVAINNIKSEVLGDINNMDRAMKSIEKQTKGMDSLYLLLKDMDVRKIDEREAYRLFYSYAVYVPLVNFSVLTYSNIKTNNLLSSLDNEEIYKSVSKYYLYLDVIERQGGAASEFYQKMISTTYYLDQNYLDANNIKVLKTNILDENIKKRGTAFLSKNRDVILSSITNMMIFSNVIKSLRFQLIKQKKNGIELVKLIENQTH